MTPPRYPLDARIPIPVGNSQAVDEITLSETFHFGGASDGEPY